MKKFVKTALAAVAAVGLMAFGASAQQLNGTLSPGTFGANDTVQLQSFGVTNVINALSTNNVAGYTNNGASATASAGSLGGTVDISGFDNLGLEVQATNPNAGASTIVVGIERVPDGVNPESTIVYSYSVTVPATTTNYIYYTNLNYDSIGSVGGVRVASLGNSTANWSSNVLVAVTTKVRKAPR